MKNTYIDNDEIILIEREDFEKTSFYIFLIDKERHSDQKFLLLYTTYKK